MGIWRYPGLSLTCLLVCLLAVATRPAAAQCPSLVWSDEFDGVTVDTTTWELLEGDGCSIGLCGWGNGELEWYRDENAVVEDGFLHIIAKRESVSGHAYTSARMRTEGRGEWTFGRFEARIRLPKGQGIWPAFWMMPTDPKYGGWPQSGEIDIMESVGHAPERVHGTVHYGTGSSASGTYRLSNADFSDDFHEFAVEREPGAIRWYVDGHLYHQVREEDVAPLFWPFDEPFHFLLNVAVGGRFPGNPDATTIFPDTMTVDYVRVYDAPRASIVGMREVVYEESGTTYSVANAVDGSTYAWQVPPGARIVGGEGTHEIVVDWGQIGGVVEVVETSTCGGQRLAIDVAVGAPFQRVGAFAAFEGSDNVTVGGRTTGFFVLADNPAPSAENDSPGSARYMRNASQQYDVLYLESPEPLEAESFAEGDLQFRLDLLSEAPPGTEIILQLEDGPLSLTSPYPTGRHSRYRAVTGPTGIWETLLFEALDRPDPDMDPTGVHTVVFLFAPNSYTSHAFYLDNFEVYGRSPRSGVNRRPEEEVADPGAPTLVVYPNPFTDRTTLEFFLVREAEVNLRIFDVMGREVQNPVSGRQSPGQHAVRADMRNLPAGFYIVRLTDGRHVQTVKMVRVGQ